MAKATSSIPTNIASKLKTKLSNVKPLLDPLPSSYLADKLDDHNKNIYATLLSAVVLSKGSITDNESRMLSMLLSRLGLDGDISRYFSQIDDISENQILEFAKTLNDEKKQLSFLFDCLLVCRIDNALENSQVEVINELCSLWELKDTAIQLLIYWVQKILGINVSKYENTASDVVYDIENNKEPLKKISFVLGKGNFYSKNTILVKGLSRSYGYAVNQSLAYSGLLVEFQSSNKGEITYFLIPLPSYLESWSKYLIQQRKDSKKKD